MCLRVRIDPQFTNELESSEFTSVRGRLLSDKKGGTSASAAQTCNFMTSSFAVKDTEHIHAHLTNQKLQNGIRRYTGGVQTTWWLATR